MRKYYGLALFLIVLVAIGPLLSALAASVVANAAGCNLNEAEIHSCVIQGHDYGHALYSAGMSLWLIIFTMPLAILMFVIWAVALGLHLARARRNRPQI